jgi:hypothetical protein
VKRHGIILTGTARVMSGKARAELAEPLELQLSATFEAARARYLAGDIEAGEYNTALRGLIFGQRAVTEWMLGGEVMH